MQRFALGLGLAVLAIVLTACSGATAAPATASPPAGSPVPSPAAGEAIVIVAKDIAFQSDALTIPAGSPTDIVLDNQDEAPHNIAIKDAAGAVGFKGEIVGKGRITYRLPAIPAGAYTFWCEVHPDMQGTITAE